jgi:ADP-ribose pyrophosphatase YjhB (NUDIX family)
MTESERKPSVPRWLEWAREIQAISQTGLHFAADDFNRGRYRRLSAIAAEIASEHAGVPCDELTRVFLAGQGYATPKISVRGAVFRDNKILLVRERSDGGWCMPGGWADVGDAPAAMVEREVREESGLVVKADRVIGVYDANREQGPLEIFHAWDIVFLCQAGGGQPGPSEETSAADFFEEDAIPPLSLARTTPRQICDAFTRREDPTAPVAFD